MKQLKVLVADDDAMVRTLLDEILKREFKLEVRLARDGEEAWSALLAGWKPDFCILDMMMPNLNGLDLTRRIREDDRFKHLPIVLCTAVGDDQAIETAARLNVLSYVMKPYQTEVLIKEIKELIAELPRS